jgi:hypothetical protein
MARQTREQFAQIIEHEFRRTLDINPTVSVVVDMSRIATASRFDSRQNLSTAVYISLSGNSARKIARECDVLHS